MSRGRHTDELQSACAFALIERATNLDPLTEVEKLAHKLLREALARVRDKGSLKKRSGGRLPYGSVL